MQVKYLKNPEVILSPFHGVGGEQRYLCEIPRAGGSTRRDLVNSEFAHLLPLFDGTREIEAVLAEHKLAYQQSRYTVASLEKLVRSYCIPNSLLIDPASTPVPAAAGKQEIPAHRYMYVKFKLFSHAVVYPIARSLGWLYSRPVLILLFSLSALLHLWFYWKLLPASGFNLASISPLQLAAMTAILIVAAFGHELGHATALAMHGSKHLQIGFGLYLYLPVLYTDVSEAWRLKPLHRALVDAGGIYFHAICQLVLLALFYLWHDVVFLYAIFTIDITITSSLNPFLRLDGYWLLTDLCGMWNLRKQSLDLARYAYRRLVRRSSASALRDMLPRSIWILAVYATVFGFFSGYLLFVVGCQLIFHVIPGYPALWLRVGSGILHLDAAHAGQLLRQLFELFWKTLLIFGSFMFVKNGVQRGIEWLASRRQREDVTMGVPSRT
jgi:putative peptide zinc metalloprotease protein